MNTDSQQMDDFDAPIYAYWIQIRRQDEWRNIEPRQSLAADGTVTGGGAEVLSILTQLLTEGNFDELRLVRGVRQSDGQIDYQLLANFEPGRIVSMDDKLRELLYGAAAVPAAQSPPQPQPAPPAQMPQAQQSQAQQSQAAMYFQTPDEALATMRSVAPQAVAPQATMPQASPSLQAEQPAQNLAPNPVPDSAIDDESDNLFDGFEFPQEPPPKRRGILARLGLFLGFVIALLAGSIFVIFQFKDDLPFADELIEMLGGQFEQMPSISQMKTGEMANESAPTEPEDQMGMEQEPPSPSLIPQATIDPTMEAESQTTPQATNEPNQPENELAVDESFLNRSPELNEAEIDAMQPAPSAGIASVMPAPVIPTTDTPQIASLEPAPEMPSPSALEPSVKPKPVVTQRATPKKIAIDKPAKLPPPVPERLYAELQSTVPSDDVEGTTEVEPQQLTLMDYNRLMNQFSWDNKLDDVRIRTDTCKEHEERYIVCKLVETGWFVNSAAIVAQFDKEVDEQLVALQVYGRPVLGEEPLKQQFEEIVQDIRARLPNVQAGFDTRRETAGSDFFSSLRENVDRNVYFSYWPDDGGKFPLFVYAKISALSSNEGYYHILIGKPST